MIGGSKEARKETRLHPLRSAQESRCCPGWLDAQQRLGLAATAPRTERPIRLHPVRLHRSYPTDGRTCCLSCSLLLREYAARVPSTRLQVCACSGMTEWSQRPHKREAISGGCSASFPVMIMWSGLYVWARAIRSSHCFPTKGGAGGLLRVSDRRLAELRMLAQEAAEDDPEG